MAGTIIAAVEGIVDEAAVHRLAAAAGLIIDSVYVCTGKSQLDRRLEKYSAAAAHSAHRWLVLRDLDHDAPCAPTLIAAKIPAARRHPRLILRVAVRAVEAWLLADAAHLSGFLAVSQRHVPPRPDELDRPKRTIVDLARRSRRRTIRDALVPEPGVSAEIGAGFSAAMITFIRENWDPRTAADRSPSLARSLRALAARDTWPKIR